jgi:hypothetical protein
VDPLRIELAGDYWRLLENVRFKWKDRRVEVPASFEFDGGSIPKVFTSITTCPMDPRFIRGFLVHDYLYAQSRKGVRPYKRKTADRWMDYEHKQAGADLVARLAIYRAVRMTCSWHWMTDKEKDRNFADPLDPDIRG